MSSPTDAGRRGAWRRRVLATALLAAAAGSSPGGPADVLRQAYVRRRFRRLVEVEWRMRPTTAATFGVHWRGVVRVSRFLEAHLEVTAIAYSRLLAIRADFPGGTAAACRELDELVAEVSGTRLHLLAADGPTTPASFPTRWASAKSLVLGWSVAERRASSVSYGRLVCLRGRAARDPEGAARAMDTLLAEARRFLER